MNLTKSRTAKLAAGVVGFAMAVTAFVPALASADTASDLQAQINSLLATIQSLQAQLAATTGGSMMSTGYVFNTNLTVGSKGTDVMNLQKVLNMSADTQVASGVSAGAPGHETSTFGPATKAAVMKFQAKYGITPVAGYVGAITRAKLNSMNTPTTPTTPTTPSTNPQGGSVSVSAGAQPANSLAPQSASRVPFTTVVLTAGSSDVTINSITVERTGLAQDAVFSGIVLLNSNGMQIGIAKTLNSNHQAMVGEPWVIKAGTSQTVTIAGNMNASLASYAGQVAGLNVVAVNTSASVSGSLPIMGAMHTINASLSLGTATLALSTFDPNSAQTKEIGTTGYKFAGVRVTAGSVEQVKLWSVRWNQSGSASSNDLANVKVYVDGTAYDTTVSADGKYYSAVFPGGILIDKGLSKDIYIQGDIAGSGASGRTVQFDLYKNTDLYMSGVTYGYGIIGVATSNCNAVASTASTASEFINSSTSCASSGTIGTPFFDGSKVTVSAGSVTAIQKATSVAAQNIAVNVPNQVLGGFTTDIKGEPITVQSMTFSIATSGTWASSGPITNITLVDSNGAVVAGPIDEASTATNPTTITFTDSVTFPIGQKTYTLKGKIPSGAPNGATVVVSATPSGWSNVTGQTTGNTISLSGNGVFSMNTMTVKSASLAISVSSAPAAQFIVAGGTTTFANYQLDASQSGEDVRFSTIPLKLTFAGGAAANDLSSCQLFDGSTALNTGSNVVNPASTVTTASDVAFTLDQSLTVAKGTVKTITLKCNVSSTATTNYSYNWGIQASPSISVTGLTSGADVTESVTASVGQVQTVSSGSFAVSVDSSTSNYTTVAAGSTGVTIGTFKFRATNESVNLTKVGLVLSTSTPSDLQTVSLYQGATLLGTATFTGSATTATSTLNSALLLAKDTDVLITIKADLSNISVSDTATEGRLVKIDVTNAEGTGVSSGGTLQVGGVTAGVNGVRMFKSFPVVSQDTLPGTGVADGKLMRFKITADSHGPVGLYNLSFSLATSGTAVTNTQVTSLILNVYSDSSYSTPVGGSYSATTGQFGPTNGTAASATLLTSAPTVDFRVPTNPLEIPAGTTYYFELKGSVAGVSTGSSVTTTLNGDAAYIDASHLGTGTGPTQPLTSTTTGALADSNNNFIWSGNATTTSVLSANDWANGYGIIGLPSGGFSVTRSQ